MSTCNRLTLQTLGSQPRMPKHLPDHRFKSISQNIPRSTLGTLKDGNMFPRLVLGILGSRPIIYAPQNLPRTMNVENRPLG
jgi:hypothetical protein